MMKWLVLVICLFWQPMTWAQVVSVDFQEKGGAFSDAPSLSLQKPNLSLSNNKKPTP